MTSSQINDDNSLSKKELLREDPSPIDDSSPSLTTTPRTPEDVTGTMTTSSLGGKFNELDNLWSSGQKTTTDNNKSDTVVDPLSSSSQTSDSSMNSSSMAAAMVLPLHLQHSYDSAGNLTNKSKNSSTSFINRTPTQPLMNKLHSLEQTWSGVKSVNSGSVSGSASISSSAYSAGRIKRQQQQQKPLSLMIPTIGDSPDDVIFSTNSTSPHPLAMNDPPTTEKAGNVRKLLFSPNSSSHNSNSNNNIDDSSSSVGESTISTVTSSESVFDRLYRLSFEKNSKSNKKKSTTTPPHQQVVSYTPKANHRSRDRLKNYSRQDHHRSSATTKSLTGGSVASSTKKSFRSMGEDNNSVFARLHRNEKRKEKLWNSPPTPASNGRNDISAARTAAAAAARPYKTTTTATSKNSKSSSSTTAKQPKKKEGDNDNDASSIRSSPPRLALRKSPDVSDSVFARLYRNEKRKEKLWTPPTPKTPPTPTGTTPKNRRRSNQSNATAKLKETTVKEQPRPAAPKHSSATTKTTTTTTLEEDLEAIEAIGEELDAMKRRQEERRSDVDNTATTMSTKKKQQNFDMTELLNSKHDNKNDVASPSSPDGDTIAHTGTATTGTVTTATSTSINNNMDLDWLMNKESWSPTAVHSIVRKPAVAADTASMTVSNSARDGQEETKRGEIEEEEECHRSQGSRSSSSAAESGGFFTLEQGISSSSLLLSPDSECMMAGGHNNDIASTQSLGSQQQQQQQQQPDISEQQLPHQQDPSPGEPHKSQQQESSIVTIQKCWRWHRCEIALASKLLHTAYVRLKFANNALDYQSEPRISAIEEALHAVDCWWILEGLLVEDDVVNVAWENEIPFTRGNNINCATAIVNDGDGDKVHANHVRVSLDLEARHSVLTASWSRHKLAIVLVKAGLLRALEEERQRGPDYAATIIQRGWHNSRQRRQRRQRLVEETPEVKTSKSEELISPAMRYELSPYQGIEVAGEDYEDLRVSLSPPKKELFGEKLLLECDELEALTDQVCSGEPTNENVIDKGECVNKADKESLLRNSPKDEKENQAAITIQNWLRISALKSAIQESPEPKMELERALVVRASSSVCSSSPESKANTTVTERTGTEDMLQIARSNSSSSDSFPWPTSGIRSDPFQHCPPFSELIEKRASALAVHNIIRAYLMALRKYRRNKKAIMIQSIWRRYQDQREYECHRFAAVMIQRIWTNYKREKRLDRYATIIQRRWKFILNQRSNQIFNFSAVSIQTSWRRRRALERYQNFRNAVICLQSVVRSSPWREDFLTNRYAALTVQRFYRRVLLERHRAAAIIIQTSWRRYTSQLKLQCSIFATVLIQTSIRRHLAVKNYSTRRYSIVLIQREWRRCHLRQLVQRKNCAALKVQSHFRRLLAKQDVEKRLQMILTIQKMVRMFLAQRRLASLLVMVRKIQAIGRSYVYKIRFQRFQIAVLHLQASWRCLCQRRRFETFLFAVRTMQRAIRGWRSNRRYMLKRNAAIKLQAAFRCYLDMRRLLMKKALLFSQRVSARKIQKCFQLYLLQQQTLRTRSAFKIQSSWRVYCARKTKERMFQQRDAAITISSLFRGWRTRAQVDRWFNAVLVLQCFWRKTLATHLAAEMLVERCLLESVAVQIQGLWRGRQQRLVYRRAIQAIECIQCHWRGAVSRDNLSRVRVATVTIQSLFRWRLVHNRMVVLHISALQIQHCWRVHVAMEQEKQSRREYHGAREIQRIWRGSFARICTAREHKASTSISSLVRGWCVRVEMTKWKESAVKIQCWWRCNLAACRLVDLRARHHLVRTKQIILIQKFWRGRCHLVAYNRSIVATLCIQRNWRGALCRDTLSRARVSAVMIQRICRRKLVLDKMMVLCESAHKIQQCWRSYVASRLVDGLRRDRNDEISRLVGARRIQCVWRGHSARLGYFRCIDASVVIQKHWRGGIAREDASIARSSSLLIQAFVRGYLCRTNNVILKLQQERTATKIQSIIRRVRIQRKFKEQVSASLCIQRYWRGARIRDVASRNRIMAIIVQCTTRGFLTRQRNLRRTKSALAIQRIWRDRHLARGSGAVDEECVILSDSGYTEEGEANRNAEAEGDYALPEFWTEAAEDQSGRKFYFHTLTQEVSWEPPSGKTEQEQGSTMEEDGDVTAELLVPEERSNAISVSIHSSEKGLQQTRESSVVCIQRIYRGVLVRRDLVARDESALKIQCAWIAFCLHKVFVATEVAAVNIQCSYRRHLAVKKLNELKWALLKRKHISAVRIQKSWCLHSHRKSFRDHQAASMIQRNWRGSRSRDYFVRVRINAIMVQSTIRRHLAIGAVGAVTTERRTKTDAAVILQRTWRSKVDRSNYLSAHQAVVRIQTIVRKSIASTRYRLLLSMCIKLQSLLRMGLSKQMYRKSLSSTVVIQAQWRTSRAQWRLMTAKYLAITLQSLVRGNNCRATIRREMDAALLVQRVWRGKACRRAYLNMKLCDGRVSKATTIQSFYRQKRCQRDFRDARSSSILIQSIWRQTLEKKRSLRKLDSICHIQRWFRSQNRRLKAERVRKLHLSSTTIQRYLRGHQKRRFIETQHRNAVIIQRAWRQAAAESAFMVKRASAIMLQSFIRGSIERKRTTRQTLQRVSAASILQRAIRRWRFSLQTKKLRASVRIQSTWRMHTCKDTYSKKLVSIVFLQSHFRKQLASKQFKRCIASCINIQRLIRSCQARRHFCSARHSAIMIQRVWRGALMRQEFELQRVCAILIQSVFRRYLALCAYFFLRLSPEDRTVMDAAARKIQMAFFLWKMKLIVDEVQSSAIILKRCMRGQLARSSARFALSHMNASLQRSSVVTSAVWFMSEEDPNAASALSAWDDSIVQAKASATIVIQSFVRRMITRNRIQKMHGKSFGSLFGQRRLMREERAAGIIQRYFSSWRSLLARRSFSSLQIQRVCRGWIARCNYFIILREFRQKQIYAMIIQRRHRGRICRRRFLCAKGAAIRLQSLGRSYVAQQHFEAARQAAVCIQSSTRRYLSNWQQEQKKISAVVMQRHYLGSICRRRFLQMKRAAIQLQCFWRSTIARDNFNRTRRAAIRIQCSTRTYFAKVEAVRLRLESQAKSEAAAEDILKRTLAKSEKRVGVLLRGGEDPCLNRLVDRVISSLHEASVAAEGIMDGKKYEEESRLLATGNQVGGIETDETFYSVENDNEAVTSAELVSTPVRSNSKSFACLTPPSVPQETAQSLEDLKCEELCASKNDELADQGEGNTGFWSSVLGMKQSIGNSTSVSAGVNSIGHSLIKSLAPKGPTTNAIDDPGQKSASKPLIKYRPGPKHGVTKTDTNYDTEIFKDEEELPSPIKSRERQDWDWADEW